MSTFSHTSSHTSLPAAGAGQTLLDPVSARRAAARLEESAQRMRTPFLSACPSPGVGVGEFLQAAAQATDAVAVRADAVAHYAGLLAASAFQIIAAVEDTEQATAKALEGFDV